MPGAPAASCLAILGPGVLGTALAAHAAAAGLRVRLAGRDAAHAEAGLERLREARRRRAAAGPGAPGDPEGRVTACPDAGTALAGADAFLEALPEDLALKRRSWAEVLERADPGTLLLTGSSSLPLAALREGLAEPGRILGFHLFLPLSRMTALELVSEAGTPPSRVARAEALAGALGRRVLRVADGPGYAAARMALAQGLEAMRLLERGVADAATLDALMVQGYGHPVGPLELSDRIGLDLRLAIARGLHAAGDPRFAPPALLERLVAQGRTGRAAGGGFHDWDDLGRRR